MSISYELAKELRENGFKQDFGWGGWICEHEAEYDPKRELFCNCTGDKLIRLPTLEELIDACGKGFMSLATLHRERKNGELYITEWCASSFMTSPWIQESGSTASEAVARLWICIHKDKNYE